MSIIDAKIYNDGSHFIAIPPDNFKRGKHKKQPPKKATTQDTKKQAFETAYKESQSLPKRERKKYIAEKLQGEFETAEQAKAYTEQNIERKKTNAAKRRTRLWRKVRLQSWNYFVTFTFDSAKANAPQVIKDFLEQWKARAITYYTNRFAEFCDYEKDLRAKARAVRLEGWKTLPEYERSRNIHNQYHKGEEPSDGDLLNLYPSGPVDKLLKENGLDYETIREKLNKSGDSIIFRMKDIRDVQERQAWLEKVIEEEKKAKLVDIVSRITRVVGTITDAADLRIGGKGDINGIISGTEGRAKVETIGAGGYNIVCFHFRTLVHEYKGGSDK